LHGAGAELRTAYTDRGCCGSANRQSDIFRYGSSLELLQLQERKSLKIASAKQHEICLKIASLPWYDEFF
jgi:hypothetical protein